MPSLYLNRLSNEDRDDLIESLLRGQGGNCFICGKPIDRVLHATSVDIDHVEPISVGGKDGPENFAICHESCNRSKQASDLRVARVLARFQTITDSVEPENGSPNLGDVLARYEGAKYELPIDLEETKLKISFPDIGNNNALTFPIYVDELSQFRYSFIHIPIEYIHHDNRMNPRSIGTNLRKLVEEFHKRRPQLHVSLAWIDRASTNTCTVRVFDGQHKAAAQVLLGARWRPVRVFIDPDKDVLLTTNTVAGTTLRQVAFDKSVQRNLGSSLLADRMNRYRKEHLDLDDDDESFSELALVNHFKGESREMRRYVIDRVRVSVTTHPENRLRDYIEASGRSTAKPLSYSTIEATFYSFFIYQGLLETAFNHRFEEGTNPRHLEIEQIVRLMNLIADNIYIGKYDESRGTSRIESDIVKGKDVPEPHLRAFRMAREEIIYNWLRYVSQIVQNYFITTGRPIDDKKLFQYQIPEVCWQNIENFIQSLMALPVWVNRDLAGSMFGSKRNNDYWQSIFETGTTPGGIQVMPEGINLMEMIKPRDQLSTPRL